MGREIRLNCPGLAPGMAGGDPVLRLRSGDPQDHLYDQCHRKPEPRDPEIDQDAGIVPDRRGSDQADLSRNPKLRERRKECQGMVCSPQPVRDNVRRALRRLSI